MTGLKGNSADNSGIYLCVIPEVSYKDGSGDLPPYVKALRKILSIQVVRVSNNGSSLWEQIEESYGWAAPQSSRRLAKSLSKGGYAGLLLFLDGVNYPSGFMCWLELFPELETNKVSVANLISQVTGNQKSWAVVLSGPALETDIVDKLWDETLSSLAHKQEN